MSSSACGSHHLGIGKFRPFGTGNGDFWFPILMVFASFWNFDHPFPTILAAFRSFETFHLPQLFATFWTWKLSVTHYLQRHGTFHFPLNLHVESLKSLSVHGIRSRLELTHGIYLKLSECMGKTNKGDSVSISFANFGDCPLLSLSSSFLFVQGRAG